MKSKVNSSNHLVRKGFKYPFAHLAVNCSVAYLVTIAPPTYNTAVGREFPPRFLEMDLFIFSCIFFYEWCLKSLFIGVTSKSCMWVFQFCTSVVPVSKAISNTPFWYFRSVSYTLVERAHHMNPYSSWATADTDSHCINLKRSKLRKSPAVTNYNA